jgi:hypothetical protein
MADIDLLGEDRIRIPDLRAPQLSPRQAEAMAAADAHPVTIELQAVLAAARDRTGLGDFGAADFLDRLRVWIADINADSDLTELGRAGALREITRFAANRLWAEDAFRRHPEAEAIALDPALVVAGLPRSGTTFLLQVLAGDRRLRALAYWEAVRPIPDPFLVDGRDTRFDLCAADCAAADALMPLAKLFHEFSPEHISEDYELQCLDFGSYYLEWLCRVPGWRDYYLSHDHTPVYRYMARLFRLLSHYSGGPNRWVTKCPQHMEQLGAIERALPGSTIVITHRDPVASIQSAIFAQAYRARVRRKRIDLDEIAAFWIDRYERLLRGCVAQRDRLDEDRTRDVYFHELMTDPMAVIEGVYARTDLPFTAQCRADLEAAIAGNPRARHGSIVYDLRTDFGLEPQAIRNRFDFYFERFPNVKVEVK